MYISFQSIQPLRSKRIKNSWIKFYATHAETTLQKTYEFSCFAQAAGISVRFPQLDKGKPYKKLKRALVQRFAWLELEPLLQWSDELLDKMVQEVCTLHHLKWPSKWIYPRAYELPNNLQWHELLVKNAYLNLNLTADDLADLSFRYQKAHELLARDLSQWTISHNDVRPDNLLLIIHNDAEVFESKTQILWSDWDLAGPVYPDVELLGIALNFSKIHLVEPKAYVFAENKFAHIYHAYSKYSGKPPRLDKMIYSAALGSWLLWLYYLLQNPQLPFLKSEFVETQKAILWLVNNSKPQI